MRGRSSGFLRTVIGAVLCAASIGVTGLPARSRAASPQAGGIEVSGTTILRNGHPWMAKGVELDASIAPPGHEFSAKYVAARTHFGAAELNAIKAFGADTIRVCVSQPGLNPQSGIYSPQYVQDVVATVRTIRRWGFAVILCMQAQGSAGMSGLPQVPDEGTIRAWQTLAPLFGRDTGVMYDLFNEPQNAPRNSWAWATWQRQHQPLVDVIRAAGARNMLIAEGIGGGRVLTGAPPLTDPLHNYVYGVHPYLYRADRSLKVWDTRFGNFSETHPVIADEWQTASTTRQCWPNSPEIAADLLRYLQARRIGVVAWAWDIVPILIRNWSFELTNFEDFHCGPNQDGGPGRMLHGYFERGVIQ